MSSNKKGLSRIVVGLLLLVVAFVAVFVCLGSGYFDKLGETVIVMLIVSFVMMAVPFIAWMINHRCLNRKRGLRICIINSLVLFILAVIWPVITIIKNEPCNYSNTICEVDFSWKIFGLALVLAVLYCLINICFWVCIDRKK